MNKKILRRCGRAGCLCLAAAVALTAPASVYASASGTHKDETVYVNLDSAGNIQSTIVSDWLHSDDATQRITDKSDLKDIQNVKSDEKSIQQGDTLSWVLNTDNTGKNIYYQGTTDKKTPLEISTSYMLDGKTVSASEIAGKSGKVKISLTLKNTAAQTVNVNGKSVTMYTPMTAIAVAVLPSSTFKNVAVNSGKILTDGNNQFITFLSMPGLSESLGLKDSGFAELSSLDLPETFTIEADAVNFSLPSIMIGATPKLVDSDKLSTSKNIDNLVDSLKSLKGLQNDLNNADPDKDLSTLITNPDRTAALKLLIDDVFDFYNLDTSDTALLAKYINDDTFALADKVTSDLTKADLKYLFDSNVLGKTTTALSKVDMKKANALMNDYATLSTFDASKLSGAAKLLSDSSAASSSLSKLLSDTSGLITHVDQNSIAVLRALSNPNVQNDLTNTLTSLSTLKETVAAMTGGSSNVSLDPQDVEAFLESYLSRNLGSLAVQAINSHAVGGMITVSGLSSIMTGLGVNPAKQQDLVNAMCGVNPSLAAAFTSADPNTAVVSAADVETALGTVLSGTSESDRKALVAPLAASLANNLTASVNDLLTNSNNLQNDLTDALGSNYVDALKGAMTSAASLQTLANDFVNLPAQDKAKVAATMQDAQSLLSDKQTLAYLGTWAQKLPAMQNDLKANSNNIAALKQLMQVTQDTRLQKSLASLPSLGSDLTSVSSLVSSLNQDFSGIDRSKLPGTVSTLLKMRTDILNSKDVMNICRKATSDDTVSVFRKALNQADSLISDAKDNGYLDKIDSAQELLARKDEYLKLADEYQIFTEAADGATTSVKFVYKTAEIKKPATEKAVQAQTPSQSESGGGIGAWFQNLFKNIRNLFHF
jgi:hypothetical protein